MLIRIKHVRGKEQEVVYRGVVDSNTLARVTFRERPDVDAVWHAVYLTHAGDVRTVCLGYVADLREYFGDKWPWDEE